MDETVREILDTLERVGTKLVAVDLLVGFEMAPASGFRTDFRESPYQMMGA